MKGTLEKTGAGTYVFGLRYERGTFKTDNGLEFDVYIRPLPKEVKKNAKNKY